MKDLNQIKQNLSTNNENTWCPGCYNFFILESIKRAIAKLIFEGEKQENFAMVTGIGCHAKIFDYINIAGIYGLHGRSIPTALGIKLGNPHLKVIAFAGDGDTYSEGMEHFIHAGRFNSDMTLIVHNNQTFALTTGQATPTSQLTYANKSEPLGEFNEPLNPIKLALASNMSFVARCDASNIEHTAEVLEQAIKHKGFSFVEIIQPCLQFNTNVKNLKASMYKVENKNDMKKALELSNEWNYNSDKGKIPIGIIYQEQRKILEEKWPQLLDLIQNKKVWKDLKK
ncbi:MAG: thiamine pyrophosphate-dependent enzyme [Nanoarchaeota archaeon]